MAKKVFLGVGHGGSDPGAVSGSFVEADINLVMALAAKKELERHGVIVGISRTKDENDPLYQEIKECNAFAPDVAIDCHNNAGASTADGFEAYIQTGTHATQSKKLASAIEKRVKATGQNSRGLKIKKNDAGSDWFGWLRECKCPAVLVEGFFVDGLKDRLDFDTKAEQEEMGIAYAHGILDYFGITVKKAESSSSTSTNSGALYLVQVGAFSKQSNATALMKDLKSKGFTAFIRTSTSNGKTLYHVQVGAYSVKANAENMVKQLKAKGYTAIIKQQ